MDIIAERALEYSDGQKTASVVVRVYRPEQRPTGEWACTLEFVGPRPFKRAWFGTDSMAALFAALRVAQMEIELYEGRLTWRGDNPWITMAPLDT